MVQPWKSSDANPGNRRIYAGVNIQGSELLPARADRNGFWPYFQGEKYCVYTEETYEKGKKEEQRAKRELNRRQKYSTVESREPDEHIFCE